MLGKLIKNEFIQTSKSLIAVYSAAGVSILFMLLSYITDISWIGITGSVALIAIGIAAIVMTVVMVINNFYRSLYSNQGYLSFTLPVKCSNLLLSKFIVSMVWIILGYIVMFLTVLFVVLYAKAKSTGILETISGMTETLSAFGSLPSFGLIAQYIFFIALGSVITVVSFISFVYFAITLANTRRFQNKPMLFGMIFFFAVYFLNKSISSFMNYRLPVSLAITSEKVAIEFVSMANRTESIIAAYGVGGKIFTLILALVLLFVTGQIMEKKVNVK